MRITKIKYHNSITELAYEELKENGQKDEFTLRSGDTPLPKFLNLMMFLRVFVLRLLEMPDTDEQIKRVKVKSVKFNYSGDNETMGAIISGVRDLELSRGVQVLNTPNKFEESNDAKQVFEKKCLEHLFALQDEALKYLNGERAQESIEFPADEEKSAEEVVADAVSKNRKKSKAKEEKQPKVFKLGTLHVRAKGKNITIGAGYANRLTELANMPGVLVESKDHKGMYEMGNGTALLLEKDDSLLSIVSAVQDGKPIAGDDLKKNVVEEIIGTIEDWAVEVGNNPKIVITA